MNKINGIPPIHPLVSFMFRLCFVVLFFFSFSFYFSIFPVHYSDQMRKATMLLQRGAVSALLQGVHAAEL